MLFCFLLCDLSFHFLDHLRQLFFAFLTGWGVNIMGYTFTVGISGRVFPLPKVIIDLVDTAGAGFTVLGFVRLKAGLLLQMRKRNTLCFIHITAAWLMLRSG